MEERRWACLLANGTLRMGTCGTAPPPRRAALLATPGAMDPRRALARSDLTLVINILADVNDGSYCDLNSVKFNITFVLLGEDGQQARWGVDHEPSHQTAHWHGLSGMGEVLTLTYSYWHASFRQIFHFFLFYYCFVWFSLSLDTFLPVNNCVCKVSVSTLKGSYKQKSKIWITYRILCWTV